MRWPRRRKPDELGALLDPVTVPSPERAKPETPQVWEVFKTDALVRPEPETVPLRPLTLADLNLHDDYIRSLLADATETIPNTQENTMPLPAQLAGITPHSTIETLADKLIETGRTARIRAEGSDTARVIHIDIDTDEPQPVHSPGWYRTMTTDAATERYGFPAPDGYPLEHTATDGSKWHLDQDGKGWTLTEYMDDDTHLLKVWEKAVLNAARKLAAGTAHSRAVTTEQGNRLFLLTEAELDRQTVVDAEVVGSSEWLRDLADRLQQYLADRVGNLNPEHAAETPHSIRKRADEVERDEQRTARDTLDRERVEPILAARWAKDRDRQFLPSLVPTWDDLTDEERAHCIDYGLELYRAGRDDQENDHA